MANGVMLKLSSAQVETLVNRLSIEDKIRLIRKLETQTWAKRLDDVVSRISKRFKENPLSEKEIKNMCDQKRQELYNARTKSRH